MAIAEYLYRHEAEFAAGFLRDAGIPFRLQIDDAGGADAGVTIARPARIWVRAEDEEDARSLLGLDGSGPEVRRKVDRPGVEPARSEPGLQPLARGERRVAGAAALLLFLLAAAGGAGAVPWVGVWEFVALALALALGLSAVSGRTLRPLKTALKALADLMS